MMKALAVVRCLFIVGTLWKGSSTADAPQMSCNLKTEFAMDLVGCVFKPFEDLLALLPSSHRHQPAHTPREQPSRHSQDKYFGWTNMQHSPLLQELKKSKTVADVFRVIHRLEDTEFEKLLVKMSPPAQRGDEDHTARRTLMEHVLKEIVNHVDFDQVIDEGLFRLLETAGALRATLLESVAEKQIGLLPDNSTIIDVICWVDSRLCKMAKCLPTYDETSFEDDITFVQCFFICEDLPIISSCISDAFEGCEVNVIEKLLKFKLDWIADFIMRVFVDLLQLNSCMLTTNFDGKEYKIEEGKSAKNLTIQSMVPPGVHCFRNVNFLNTPLGTAELLVQFLTGGMSDCNVEIQLSTSNYVRDLMTLRLPETIALPIVGPVQIGPDARQYPICRSGRGIPQYVIGWHKYANESSGVIQLTKENWNVTFNVPIDAAIDYKVSIKPASKFYQQDFLTLKVRAQMFTKFSSKIQLVRTDLDEYQFRSCWVLNGPHLRTFDGHYYNNFYEGHFVLYRHKTLPYEVQTVTQPCPHVAKSTCTCAVSVRSGDDVFTVDSCRRSKQSQDHVITKVALYLIGDLTKGTRIYRHDEGVTYKVMLPHGMLVTITNTEGHLNVWVRPSAYDRLIRGTFWRTPQVEGLCGDFDGSAKKDLRTRDGKVYKGKGAGYGEQPQDFNKDWRITEADDIIMWGVNNTDKSDGDETQQTCACTHILMMGTECKCGYDILANDCDVTTDGKLPYLFPLISKYSQAMFYTDQPDQEVSDKIDFSNDYMTKDPKVHNWVDNNATIRHCKELVEKDSVQLECNILIDKVMNSIKETMDWMSQLQIYQQVCQRNAQLGGKDAWSLSSKMAARQHCHDMLDLTSLFSEKALQPLNDIDCPNDCSRQINTNNDCVNGTCICDEHQMGPDCSLPTNEEPTMLMPKFSPCDTRHQNCNYVTVYGKNFIKDKVFCHHNQSGETICPDILTSSQLACKLPIDAARESVTISITGKQPQLSISAHLHTDEVATPFGAASFQFVAFDSLCFIMDKLGQLQKRQEADHCLVDNTCYKPEQASAKDECYVCYANVSISELLYSISEECMQRKADEEAKMAAHRKEWTLRIGLSSALCGLVVITTIIAFFMTRGKKPDRSVRGTVSGNVKTTENGDLHNVPPHSTDHEMNHLDLADAALDNRDIPDGVAGIDNLAIDFSANTTDVPSTNEGSPGNHGNDSGEFNAREMAEFWQIKHLAAQRSGMRSVSQGSRASSVASRGIGGSGASLFSTRTRSSTTGSVGIGGVGPAHLARFRARAYSETGDDDEVAEKIGLGGGGAIGGMCVRL